MNQSTTLEISKIWRRAYICTALEYRRAGRREDKRNALRAAYLEKLNALYFLGSAPF